MIFLIAVLGAALIAYPVFAAIGLGLSICVFLGLICLMAVIYCWFFQTAKNTLSLMQRLDDNFFALERIERILRK